MNIAIIIERFDPTAGGAERSTAEVAAEIAHRGHQVTILTGKAPHPELTPELQFRTCPTGLPKGLMRLLLFRRWIRKQLRQSIVNGQSAIGNPFDASLSVSSLLPAQVLEPRAGLIRAIQSRSLAWRSNAFSRLMARIIHFLNIRAHLLLALERKTLRDPAIQHIACISRFMLDQSAHYYPAVANKLVHIPNAVKPVSATPDEIAHWRHLHRQSWSAAANQTVFLFPSFDSRRKGLTPLLHAFALLRKNHPQTPALLVLVGRIHHSHHALMGKLGLFHHTRIVEPLNDLRPCYVAADVTVLPTYYDSFGRVVIESLLLGRPAITTAFAGAAELVAPPPPAHPRGRVIADPDDQAALARALFELCDPQERSRCVAGAETIAQTYTTTHHVDLLLPLLSRQKQKSPAMEFAGPS